jgi:hypothetical protein
LRSTSPGKVTDTSAMGIRTRGLDIKAGAARLAADRAARAEATALIDRWNEQLAAGRDMLWSPTIRAALLAGTPWLDVFCPRCGTSRAIDLRTVDRHPLATRSRWAAAACERPSRAYAQRDCSDVRENGCGCLE